MASPLMDLMLQPIAADLAGSALGLARETLESVFNAGDIGDSVTGSSTPDFELGSATPDNEMGSSTGDHQTGSTYP